MKEEIYQLLQKLEWSDTIKGMPSCMGLDNGRDFPACPLCHGLKESNNDFNDSAVGHRPTCDFLKVKGL